MGEAIRWRISIAAILLLACVAVAVVIRTRHEVVPRDWSRLNGPPAANSQESNCADFSGISWQVSFQGGMLAASRQTEDTRVRDPVPYELDFSQALYPPLPAPPPPPDSQPGAVFETPEAWTRRYAREFAARRVVRVADGWLIGFDGGENDGSLWWYPSAPGAGTKLWPQNVQAIEPLGAAGNYVVLSGLDHVGPELGTVLWLNTDGGQWAIRERAKLDGQAFAHAVHPDGLVVATRAHVSVIGADRSVRQLIPKTLTTAYPMSAAVAPSGEIAIGRRFFVSLLRPRGNAYIEELFIPSACRRVVVTDFECNCIGTS